MSLSDRILKARPRAEKVLVDICRVTRPNAGQGTLNRSTGFVAAPATTVVYGPGVPDAGTTGKCLIGQRSERRQVEGGQHLVVVGYVASLPATSPELLPGDSLEVLTCQLDPTLVGDSFEVGEPQAGSLIVLRVVPLVGRRHSVPSEG